MGVYLNGQLVIADDALVTGDVKLLGGGAVKTVDNNDLTLLPNGTGITIVGDAGAPNHLGTPTNDDLFVAGRLEVDGIAYLDSTVIVAGTMFSSPIYFGGSSTTYGGIYLSSDDGTLFMAGSSDGNGNHNIIITSATNRLKDHDHDTLSADPTLFIHSATDPDSDNTQWISICHDKTDAVLGSGKGDIKISTVANQTLVLVQSVWDDMRVPLLRGITGASNPPAFTQFKDNGAASVGVYAWAFAYEAVAGNEDQMWFVTQLPHTYKEGTNIKAHIHWSPAVSGAAGEFVKWGLEYTWQNVDGTFGNTTIITSDATSASTATTSGDGTLTADKHYVTSIGTITGTSMNLSSMLVCRIFRNSSDASDDLVQAAFAFEVDFHHEVNTMGSRQEFIK